MVFLFCATSFGVVLTLGGLRYSSVETEIYLLTTQLLDLRAAAALSIVQLVAVTVLLAGRPGCARRPTRRSRGPPPRPRRPRRGDLPRSPPPACCWSCVAAPVAALVVGSLRVDGGWGLANYRALSDARPGEALLVPVTEALVTSLRTAVDATWMALLLGGLVALVVTRRSRSRPSGGCAARARRLLHAAARGLRGDRWASASSSPSTSRRWRCGTPRCWCPIAQALVALPLVVRTLAPVLSGVDDRQRQAAASLGAGPLRVLTVDLPVVWKPLLAAAGFAFAVSLGEFGATAFLARDEHPTLPVVIFQLIGRPGGATTAWRWRPPSCSPRPRPLVMLAVERLRVPSVGAF